MSHGASVDGIQRPGGRDRCQFKGLDLAPWSNAVPRGVPIDSDARCLLAWIRDSFRHRRAYRS